MQPLVFSSSGWHVCGLPFRYFAAEYDEYRAMGKSEEGRYGETDREFYCPRVGLPPRSPTRAPVTPEDILSALPQTGNSATSKHLKRADSVSTLPHE